MIDIKELRRLAQTVQSPAHNINERVDALNTLHNTLPSNVVLELLDRLEAAESDALEQARLNGMGASREAALMAKLEAAEKTKSGWLRANAPGGWIDDLRVERDYLLARVEATEELVRELQRNLGSGMWRVLREERDTLQAKVEAAEKQEPVARFNWSKGKLERLLPWDYSTMNMKPLYLASGAQPTPIIPEGWLRAIDEALIVAHIGVANESDTYEQAKAKLDNLIGFHVDVATDPAVNGGYKLVSVRLIPKTKGAME